MVRTSMVFLHERVTAENFFTVFRQGASKLQSPKKAKGDQLHPPEEAEEDTQPSEGAYEFFSESEQSRLGVNPQSFQESFSYPRPPYISSRNLNISRTNSGSDKNRLPDAQARRNGQTRAGPETPLAAFAARLSQKNHLPHVEKNLAPPGKSFLPRTDKNGDKYYVSAHGRVAPTWTSFQPGTELYYLSNWVLDLDAEGAKGVREYTKEDEERLARKWAVNARREEVKGTLHKLKDQIFTAREKMVGISRNRLNPWRINPHDMLSAALQGLPTEPKPTFTIKDGEDSVSVSPDTPETRNHTTSAALNEASSNLEDDRHLASQIATSSAGSEAPSTAQTTQDQTPSQEPPEAFLPSLLSENAVPDHAMHDQIHVLQWMLIRQKQTARARHRRPISPHDFLEATGKVTSIRHLRRLVFQCLDEGLNIGDFAGVAGLEAIEPSVSMSEAIREALMHIFRLRQVTVSDLTEALVFLQNFRYRLEDQAMRVSEGFVDLVNGLAEEVAKQHDVAS